MAEVTKRANKKGTTYLIRAFAGYDANGRQVRKSMTWAPPKGMSEAKADKEAKRQAVLFEESFANGEVMDGKIKFADFAEKWLEDYARPNLRQKTTAEYQKQLPRVLEAIGHIRLQDLKTGHLNKFYSNLQEEGMNLKTGGKLSPTTIRIYHRLVSSILGKAVKWGNIQFNPALNAELPKMKKTEAAYLDEADARRCIELLHGEPIKYRAAITFDLLSGLRRGEVLGLRWQDVSFDDETIRISQTLQYIPKQGLVVDDTKNETSARPVKLSRSAFLLLKEYKAWQDEQKENCGAYWKNKRGFVFTHEDGAVINPDNLTRWFTEFARDNGFDGIHVHSLRHSYASLMIADGTPIVVVSKRLGHSNVGTTANIYSHMIQSAEEKAAKVGDQFADVVSSPPKKKGKQRKSA
jgi:integrase